MQSDNYKKIMKAKESLMKIQMGTNQYIILMISSINIKKGIGTSSDPCGTPLKIKSTECYN